MAAVGGGGHHASVNSRRCGSRPHSDSSPGFKMALVDASTEFKVVVVVTFACTDASVNSQDDGHVHLLLAVVLLHTIQDGTPRLP